ncbi:MAG: hypothetical protein SH857_14640, partial [Chitinophagales bacterium]|nr:hypothetical protein [Chitinophagales bacterium]
CIYLREFWYALDFVKLCLLLRSRLPHMQFLFVSANIRSLAYFSASLTANHLATYYTSGL